MSAEVIELRLLKPIWFDEARRRLAARAALKLAKKYGNRPAAPEDAA